MRRLAATIFTLILIAMFLWAASPVYAGQASVTADCENWYVTILTLGSQPEDWTVTLDGQPVEDGTYTIPDSVNETRTFTVVWTRGDRQDVKTYTGERSLICGTTTTETTVPDSTTTTTEPSATSTRFSSTSAQPTSSTSSISVPPSTLPYTGMNPMTTLAAAGVLFVLAGLVWAVADSRREDE